MFPSVVLLTQQVCRGRVSFKTHCAADRQRGTSTKHLADCSDNRQAKHSHRERGVEKKTERERHRRREERERDAK